eukprot:scaffold35485_cov19-Tisochrysis_lutea.AAC.1
MQISHARKGGQPWDTQDQHNKHFLPPPQAPSPFNLAEQPELNKQIQGWTGSLCPPCQAPSSLYKCYGYRTAAHHRAKRSSQQPDARHLLVLHCLK